MLGLAGKKGGSRMILSDLLMSDSFKGRDAKREYGIIFPMKCIIFVVFLFVKFSDWYRSRLRR